MIRLKLDTTNVTHINVSVYQKSDTQKFCLSDAAARLRDHSAKKLCQLLDMLILPNINLTITIRVHLKFIT